MYLDGISAREERDFLWTTQWNIWAIIQRDKFRFLRDLLLFTRHYSSGTVHASLFTLKFMDESRWIFGEKEKDFLVATPRNFSTNKRINPKRFQHLNGWLGLHQGFHDFSYK